MPQIRTDIYDVEKAISSIVSKYSARPTALIMVLQDIQKHYKYLPMEALAVVSKKMVLPLAQIYSVATFYKSFSLEPKGKHHICVCTGTACHVRQAKVIVDNLELMLGIKPRETTKDGEISYETVNCLGACAMGPLLTVNEKYYGDMTVTKLTRIVNEIRGIKNATEAEEVNDAA